MIHETPRQSGRHDPPEGPCGTRRHEETPELVKSRLYKTKVDLLVKLRSAAPHLSQDIVERLKETERRLEDLTIHPPGHGKTRLPIG